VTDFREVPLVSLPGRTFSLLLFIGAFPSPEGGGLFYLFFFFNAWSPFLLKAPPNEGFFFVVLEYQSGFIMLLPPLFFSPELSTIEDGENYNCTRNRCFSLNVAPKCDRYNYPITRFCQWQALSVTMIPRGDIGRLLFPGRQRVLPGFLWLRRVADSFF